jgi:uncharacterized protein (DUF1697 family)
MARWVALLRGADPGESTGGAVPGATEELVDLVDSLGFDCVSAVPASGDVVFDAQDDLDAAAVRACVEEGLREGLGQDAWVVLLEPERLAAIAGGYPFERTDAREARVVFTADDDVVLDLAARAREEASHDEESVEGAGDVLYWQAPRGAGSATPFARLLSAEPYEPRTTTRGLSALEEVLAAVRG